METTCADSFELFYGLFRFNPHSHSQLRKLRDSFAEVERQVCLSCCMRPRVCVSEVGRQRERKGQRGILQQWFVCSGLEIEMSVRVNGRPAGQGHRISVDTKVSWGIQH